MKKMNEQELIACIEEAGRVTLQIWKQYFTDLDAFGVRRWLKEHGLPEEMTLELRSCELAYITPNGVVMQVRGCDAGSLGVWGGGCKWYESYESCAMREAYEETGLILDEENLELVGMDNHFHEYANGHKAFYYTARYRIVFQKTPEIIIDGESLGYKTITSTEGEKILPHQVSFINDMLAWWEQNKKN